MSCGKGDADVAGPSVGRSEKIRERREPWRKMVSMLWKSEKFEEGRERSRKMVERFVKKARGFKEGGER